MDAADDRSPVPENVEQQTEQLTTEQMIALLSQPASAELANRIAETYETVERIYNASLNIGTFSASAASTNTTR